MMSCCWKQIDRFADTLTGCLLLLLLQAMLEEDGLRFDAFLKDNDEKVQEAIKRADTEAKAKQDKVSELADTMGNAVHSCD
jgi:antitoxin component of RelBE/YafQ-DinJ toxin-antitoxin module